MKRLMLLGALALTTTAQAQVVVRAPGVYVEVGPAVIVRAWGVEVFVPRRSVKPLPPPMTPAVTAPVDPSVPPVPKEEDLLLPPPIPVPGAKDKPATTPPATPVSLRRAVTPGDFVKAAKRFEAGMYDVVFLHPYTNKPVKVQFELPVSPRRVNVLKNRIEFRWGLLRGMDVQFEPDGTVRVKG
jgi:hypothetical protein